MEPPAPRKRRVRIPARYPEIRPLRNSAVRALLEADTAKQALAGTLGARKGVKTQMLPYLLLYLLQWRPLCYPYPLPLPKLRCPNKTTNG